MSRTSGRLRVFAFEVNGSKDPNNRVPLKGVIGVYRV